MPLPDEELLSAYLDGELSTDERSRVERLLAQSPESRQLLEELRSMQASLQRMPRSRLGHEFADQVLKQAEKELLTAGTDEQAVESADEKRLGVAGSARAETAGPLGQFSWQRLRRPVIWASLTLAAGLLIMFLDRERGPRAGRQVAMAPRAAQEREDQQAVPENAARLGRAAQGGDRVEIGAPAEAPRGESLEEPPAASEQPESQAKRGPSQLPAGAAATAPTAGLTAPEDRGPPPAAAAGRRSMRSVAGEPLSTDADNDAPRALSEQRKEQKEEAARGLVDRLHFLASAKNTVVVWCDVAPGTGYRESFRTLLADHNIRWQEAEPVEGEALGDWEAKADVANDKGAEKDARLRLTQENRPKRLADAEQAVWDANNEVVLVEADQPQIEAVLAAIDGAASVFVNVEVEPPVDAPKQQQQLERFARGNASADKHVERDDSRKQAGKREETPPMQPAKSASAEADQKKAATGTARRLAARPARQTDEKTSEAPKDESLPPAAQTREGNDLAAPSKKPVDAFSLGLGGTNQQAASKDRVQVLFVLHPVEANSRPEGAKASDAEAPAGDH